MEIEKTTKKVRELFNGYQNKGDDGVVAFGGKLNVRPAYQRNFVYNYDQMAAVIETIKKGFPLNIFYWSWNKDDNCYDLIDGQQRTISILSYLEGDFSINNGGGAPKFWENLTTEEQEQILNYELDIYICSGAEKDKLEWFKVINTAGERLNDQELRNSQYSGPWLTDAKKMFSRNNCPANDIGKKYIKGKAIRQEILELVLKWISNNNIEDYMAKHQKNENAKELWEYFEAIIIWIKETFLIYRKEMLGLNWGYLYNRYKHIKYDTNSLELKTSKLMADKEILNKKGIYEYLLSGNEKHLNLRVFDDSDKTTMYEMQKGFCMVCNKHFNQDEMEADHKIPWSKGGKTEISNGQMLCRSCNRTKSNK